jgi:hypothetical protein
MAWDPDHIDFISEYCDRWCERCSLAHKCAAFTRKDDPGEIDDCSKAADKAMEELRLELAMPEPPLRPWQEGTLIAPAPGDMEQLEAARVYDERWRRIQDNPLMVAAHDYAVDSYTWLCLFGESTCARAEAAPGDHRESPDAALVRMEVEAVIDAVQVVRWDCMLIAAKLRRALDGMDSDVAPVGGDHVQTDGNGSAKLVLLLVERSEASWRLITRWAPEVEIASGLADTLAGLRVAVERAYPNARRFVRPGFDETPL